MSKRKVTGHTRIVNGKEVQVRPHERQSSAATVASDSAAVTLTPSTYDPFARAYQQNPNVVETQDGQEFEVSYEPITYFRDAVTIEQNEEGETTIHYLTYSEVDTDYEFMEGVRFEEFRSAGERDGHIAKEEREGKTVFVVNKYAHGNVHYSVAGTRSYPDERFDVAPSSVISIDPEIYENADEATANDILDDYSQWCNGEVYGMVRETFDRDGESTSCEARWDIIGMNNAKTALEDKTL